MLKISLSNFFASKKASKYADCMKNGKFQLSKNIVLNPKDGKKLEKIVKLIGEFCEES